MNAIVSLHTSSASQLLRDADAATARALLILAREQTDPLLALDARLLPWEAKSLLTTADVLRAMPRLRAMLSESVVSASQVRAIARVVARLQRDQREQVDTFIARRAPELPEAEPGRLVSEVEDLVARLRDDLVVCKESRAIASSFLALQPRLDGGGSLYGEADAQRFAAIAEAIEDAAGVPDPDVTRGLARMDGLVGICESWMAGSIESARPKPRFLVTYDASAGDARLHAPVSGAPVRISSVSTQTLLCDAELLPVFFEGSKPVATGTKTQTVPDTTRRAVVARDGGCRFPSCDAPVHWSDCHHITPRSQGGTHEADNLVLLCRIHHRLMHQRAWRIEHRDDGGIAFRHRGTTTVSYPRARFPARE